ncbi:MAG: hypothetical protein GTO54_11835, partial [Nitrososphaeria archaeon]|nr:hypothetical protein [Nitrososphaeria archaeon]
FTASGFSDRYKDAENILRKMARDVRAIVVSDFLYAPKPMSDLGRKSAVYADAVSGKRGSGGDVTDL